MMIDAHMHVNFKGFKAKDVISYLDKHRIDQCWLLTWEEINPVLPHLYTPISVEETFEAYTRYPSRIIPMYAPDPGTPNLEAIVKSWYHKGIKGCGELKISTNWGSADLDSLLTVVDKLKLPLIFHMEEKREVFFPPSTSSLFPGYLTDFFSLEERLRRHPRLNFIGHGPMFWKGLSSDWSQDPLVYPNTKVTKEGITCDLLSKYDNLYADTSGPSGFNALSRDKKFAKKFLTTYSHKILYGTDNFDLGLHSFLIGLGLPQSTYHHILYENAARLISL